MPDGIPKFRSNEELAMRDLLVPELRRRWPDARIVHELPLRYSTNRIDLAAITETELVCVEIKSSKDVADRLEAQLRAFFPISHRLIVALAPKWNESLPLREEKRRLRGRQYTAYAPQYTEAQQAIRRVSASEIEIWTADAEAATLKQTDGFWVSSRRPWAAQMLDMLHVAELHRVCADHRLPGGGPRSTHAYLSGLCADYLKGREVVRAVCRALRAREGFGAASDAPIAREDQIAREASDGA